MELREYVGLLRKWLWLILVCALAAGAIAYIVSKNTTPVYEASSTLRVNQASNPATTVAYADILTSERLARTYATLLTSRPVLEETARRLGVDVKSLEDAVTVTPVRDTLLLKVTVEGPNARLISDAANVLPQVFIDRDREQQLGQVSKWRESLEGEIEATLADITRTTNDLAAAADDSQKTRLEASLAQYRTTYSSLLANAQQARTAEAQATNNLVVSEPAVAPEVPIRPRTFTNTLLALVIGAMLAVGAAFLAEYLDDTVKTADDVSRVTGLSTLGAIARLKDAGGTRQLIAWLKSKAPETEAYRTLRTNIQFSSVDKPIKTLLVTSSSPGEGKSTTTANLAVVMAQTGQQVIVVDTDLRRPVLHKVFEVPNNAGLTTALLAGEGVDIESHLQPTEIDHLSVLTSGPIPPNPSELLGSHRMTNLVAALSQHADLVIFDSPPVLAVTDAAVLARQVDGVLLVADAGRTKEHALTSAAAELEKTGGNVLGVALNRLDVRRGYNYYYYYYYSDEEGGERKRSSQRRKADGSRLRLPWQKPA
ncbi:MAG: polysaccharide biosynthesis tyrosine autokinase [Anaerolineae bacterium]|jgi:non-specific protein-tyrosine kinase|nr:polysaccharide biosynthesis tyrosine autokinase [Anaerolineae bacterium]